MNSIYARGRGRSCRLAPILAALTFALALSISLPGSALARGGGWHHGHGRGDHAGLHGHGHGHFTGWHHPGGHHGHGRVVKVMTRNLYLGADLTPAIGAPTLEALAAANGQILREVTANDFPVRAEGLAAEIRAERPDLVGLQEVALWRTAPPSIAPLATGPSAGTVRYDYLAELLAALNAPPWGPHYEAVVVQPEFDLEAPADENGEPGDGPAEQGIPNAEINGRLTMRDVILARVGAGVHTWDPQSGHFATLLEVPVLGHPLPITRGWAATEASVRGSGPFRFLDTHLEAYQPEVRAAQAAELVAPGGPASGEAPVVLVGDLNSDYATAEGADRLAYEAILGAGFAERSTDEPLSCCLGSSLLAEGAGGSVADFDHQVDHIMTNDPEGISLRDSQVTGLLPVNGFWHSDHAGIASALEFTH